VQLWEQGWGCTKTLQRKSNTTSSTTKKEDLMRNVFVLTMIVALSGCATVPNSKLSWESGNYNISVLRSGCELSGIEVKNNSSKVAKIFGTIDALDSQSNTISTVKFGCDNAHPGGIAMCRGVQTYNDKLLYAMPGLYCAGYSRFTLSVQSY
jgi:hypothetical protein